MRPIPFLLILCACGSTIDELAEQSDVEALEFDDDTEVVEVVEDDPVPTETEEPEEPPEIVEPPTTDYTLDVTANPVLGFRAWGMFNIPANGVWNAYNVRVTDLDGPESYAISFICDMDSLDAGNRQLNSHIRTDDFLDVPNHPEARFDSTSVTSLGGDLYEITGDMTLRGATQTISFEATIEPLVGQIHTEAEIEFSRWDFGLYADDVTRPGGDSANDRVVVTYDVWLRTAE